MLVGLAILSAVAGTALVARGRALRQLAEADRRVEAAAAADALLAEWWRKPDEFPRDGGGAVPGGTELLWRVQSLSDAPEGLPDLEVVRLTVMDARPPKPAVLVAVELVLPEQREPPMTAVVP